MYVRICIMNYLRSEKLEISGKVLSLGVWLLSRLKYEYLWLKARFFISEYGNLKQFYKLYDMKIAAISDMLV